MDFSEWLRFLESPIQQPRRLPQPSQPDSERIVANGPPEWVIDKLPYATPNKLIDSNPKSSDCTAFIMTGEGKLVRGKGYYHTDLVREYGAEFLGLPTEHDYDSHALAGRYGPFEFIQGVREFILPIISFYPPQNPKFKAMRPAVVRRLAGEVGEGAWVCVQREKPVPITQFIGGGPNTNTWHYQYSQKVRPGGRIWNARSESVGS